MSSVYATSSTPKSEPVVFRDDFKVAMIRDEGEYDEELLLAYDAGHLGRITIFDRRTGFGWRDVETGFRDTYAMNARGKENYGKNFWLASGHFNIKNQIPDSGLPWSEVVRLIKDSANTCIGEPS